MIFFLTLTGYPEWTIPMMKLIPMLYTEDSYDASSATWSVECHHTWHIIPNDNPTGPNTIELRVEVYASATKPNPASPTEPTPIPIYIDFNLVYFNERVAQEINPSKT
jgi:hypothetical protein